jgi:uncharacterized repeat protein (TIGR01451 family)
MHNMKLKHILTSSLAAAAIALIAGCSSKPMDITGRQDQTIASIPQVQAGYDTFGRQWGQTPATETAVAQAPAAEPAKPCSSEVKTGLMKLSKTTPATAALGETYESDITATALTCVGNVTIVDRMPAGASFVKSDPAATVDGNNLVWKISDMDAGQSLTIKVWLKADQEGTLMNCAMVSADPRICAATVVGKPNLTIQKSGPITAALGSDVAYNILVSNAGSAVAKNVVVTDPVPDGLSGQPVSVTVGDLAPGQSTNITATFKADKRGKTCNTAEAASDNAGKVDSQACTVVQQAGLKVEKTGDNAQIIGRKANYEVAVFNTGDTLLENVTVVDTAPNGTEIASADGATISGNTATWKIDQLAAGDKKTFDVTLLGKMAGQLCNTATATAGSLTDTTQTCTTWKGVAGVLLEMVDDPDPIQVGENVTYTIKVTNQGFADLHNIGMTAQFNDEIDPVSTPQGTVSGKTVSFPVIPVLEPKKVATYTIIGKGVKAGDHITTATLTADEITKPVKKEESTTVY